ncbi:MAG: (deoxy)nucleoside triphosphate pyrophosphohydrolase [Bacteroidales bacterium]
MQRAYGEFKGKWEFPGGKIEIGESHTEALHREIKEELDIEICIDNLICKSEWKYPSYSVTIYSFMCRMTNGSIELKDHSSYRWLSKENLYDVNWIDADIVIVDKIRL